MGRDFVSERSCLESCNPIGKAHSHITLNIGSGTHNNDIVINMDSDGNGRKGKKSKKSRSDNDSMSIVEHISSRRGKILVASCVTVTIGCITVVGPIILGGISTIIGITI